MPKQEEEAAEAMEEEPQQTPAGFQDFTMGQRWGTFLLNWVLPGLGSFVIMQDTVGGFVNLGLGMGAYLGYILFWSTAGWVDDGWRFYYRSFPAFWIAGLGLHIGQVVHNAWRSFNYTRPMPAAMAFIFENDALDIGLVSGRNGIEGVSFTFTFSY